MKEFKKFEKEIEKYLEEFILEEDLIKHTNQVVAISEYIAKKLSLDEVNIELAKVIASLHQIGNFENIKRKNALINEEGTYAEWGIKVLFDENLIRRFIDDTKYDKVIKKAIENHNKYKMNSEMDEQELLHTKILMDARKIENFISLIEDADLIDDMIKKTVEQEKDKSLNQFDTRIINYESMSQTIYDDFMNNKSNLIDRKTKLDYWTGYISIIFELNFAVSLQYVKENKYIDTVIDRFEYKDEETKEKMEQIRKHAKQYIEKRIV